MTSFELSCAAVVAAMVVLASPSASAYDLKHAPGGQNVRWGNASVAFVIDPSVDAAVPGGSAAVAAALRAWSGVGGAPALSSRVGPGGAEPKYDGQNSIIYMPGGYAPAGNALAITISTIDDSTGELLDTDIVFNGAHPFAVLPAGASNPDAVPMATDGASEGGSAPGSFDLLHVAAHEVGHAVGLGDVLDDEDALMYGMTAPDSAANRTPSSDDEAGVRTLYAGADFGSPRSAGCASSTVAGVHARAGDAWLVFAALTLVLAAPRARRPCRRRESAAVPRAGAS
jgi:hypothetical protein